MNRSERNRKLENERKLLLVYLQADENGEVASPEAREALNRLVRERVDWLFHQQFEVNPAGHPEMPARVMREQRAFCAALEVETRMRNGKTCTQATIEIADETGIDSRQIERYRQWIKSRNIMAEPMANWEEIVNVMPWKSNPPISDDKN
jgi:hypothetical protein